MEQIREWLFCRRRPAAAILRLSEFDRDAANVFPGRLLRIGRHAMFADMKRG
ncbi:hypothetical protein J8I29_06295 [Labrys sp. LIt4]|uniref:hypothetical protein n=1 Tax=Labrys TaxID=204476 RepID=UPI0015E33AF4|nr:MULTISPECIES: hypothetical protein [Labrys]MBP0578907.1 hypothetical protein [Labrys sp. LIt4]